MTPTLNFIPEAAKRAHFQTAFLYVLREWLAVLFILAVITALSLDAVRGTLERIAANGDTARNSGEETIARDIAGIRREITELQVVRDHERWIAPVIADFLNIIPSGIHIRSMELDAPSGALTLQGRADTRGALINFESTLRSSSRFKEIRSPLGAITQPTNISFTLNATVTVPPCVGSCYASTTPHS